MGGMTSTIVMKVFHVTLTLLLRPVMAPFTNEFLRFNVAEDQGQVAEQPFASHSCSATEPLTTVQVILQMFIII